MKFQFGANKKVETKTPVQTSTPLVPETTPLVAKPKVETEIDLTQISKSPDLGNNTETVYSQAQMDVILNRVTVMETNQEKFMLERQKTGEDLKIRQQCAAYQITADDTERLVAAEGSYAEKLEVIITQGTQRIIDMQTAFRTKQGAVGGHDINELIQQPKDGEPKDQNEAVELVQRTEGLPNNEAYAKAKLLYPNAFDRKAQFARRKAERSNKR